MSCMAAENKEYTCIVIILKFSKVIKLGNTNLVHVTDFVTKSTNRCLVIIHKLIIDMVHNLNVHLVVHCPKWPLSTI